MDSLLDFDRHEVDLIVNTLVDNKDLFKQHAAALFEDSFLMLTSTQAKGDSFKVLSQLTAYNEESKDTQKSLNELLDCVLNICAQVFKAGIRTPDEFQLVLDDIGLKGSRGAPILEVFQKVYLPRVQLINDMSEDLTASMTGSYSKKNPLNLQLSDENLSVSNPKLVDVEWKVIYNLSSKHLNKLHQPKFLITLTLLCQGDF